MFVFQVRKTPSIHPTHKNLWLKRTLPSGKLKLEKETVQIKQNAYYSTYLLIICISTKS